MLKLWGDGRGVMGRGGDKCGVAVLGIWGSRKWVAGERGTPSEIRGGDGEHGTPNVIRETRGCAAPDGVLLDPRSPQTPNAIRGARGHMAFVVPVDTWRSGRRARFVPSMAARRLQTSGAICVDRGCMAPRVPSTIRSS